MMGEINLRNLGYYNLKCVDIGIKHCGKRMNAGSFVTVDKPFYVKILESCNDENFKTRQVRHPKDLPVGEFFLVSSILRNFYGEFLLINYNDYEYSIDPKYVSYYGMEDENLINKKEKRI